MTCALRLVVRLLCSMLAVLVGYGTHAASDANIRTNIGEWRGGLAIRWSVSTRR